VFWVDSATIVEGGASAAAVALFATPAGTAAVLERDSLDEEAAQAAVRDDSAAGPVSGQIVRLSRNQIEISVNAPAQGVVVVHETYYPHWEATIDGQPAPIVPANVMFRGVVVGPGAHTIVMTYRPPWFRSLAVISLLSWIAACAIAIAFRRRKGATR
jgi:uncharacterized membrane protein YfhO